MPNATIIASHGRHFAVRTDGEGQVLDAVTRGRKGSLAAGDRVRIQALGSGQAVIESVAPRRNIFQRSDAYRAKLLAANLDQAGVVIAAEPPFSEELLLRVLLAAEAEAVPIALIVNKHDLVAQRAAIEPRIAAYRALGYPIFDCSAGSAPEETRDSLQPWLCGKTTLLLGESGMGKSTLVNCLVPDAQLRTQAISQALASGRHTTTFTRMFQLPTQGGGAIIDSPGFQNFGLDHLSESQRVHAMPEFRPLLGQCRFHNCTHTEEPGCAIRAAVQSGDIDSVRYRLFLRVDAETRTQARRIPGRG